MINSYINDMWQIEGDKCHENKLYGTNPRVRNNFFTNFKSRFKR